MNAVVMPCGQGGQVEIFAVDGVPLVTAGADLAGLIVDAITVSGRRLCHGDVVIVAQKIVSKSEGRLVLLDDVLPSPEARAVAARVGKDPRIVELILAESTAIVRERPGLLIVRHKLGLVLANAGIDQSNIDHSGGEAALLLPEDPDASCRRLRQAIARNTGAQVAVMIIDSLGRAWRMGTVGTAIGISGLPALLDLRGKPDIHGRALQTSELGIADEIAAAASLVMGQGAEARPAVILRGLDLLSETASAADLVRPGHMDLFP